MTKKDKQVVVVSAPRADASTARSLVTRAMDGFKNLITNFGVRGRDRTTANQPDAAYLVTYPELTALYVGDGLTKRIVSMPANDATRVGWDIEGDPDGKLVAHLESLGVVKEFTNALKWQRLYGGALTIMLWDDGLDLASEFRFNPKRKLKLKGVRTHSPAEIWFLPTDIDTDPTSLRYGKPTHFTIRRVLGPPYVVHYTRVLEWLGDTAPNKADAAMDMYRRYYGFGVMQSMMQSLSDLGISWSAVANLFQESVIGKYKISNLENLIAEKDYDSVYQRMANIELSKSALKGVLLGAEEEYSRDSLPFTGVADVMDRFMMRVASEVGIPVSLLFGRSAAGMNATGEGDARMYYDSVEALQNDELKPKLLQIIAYTAPEILPDVPFDEFAVKFRPVWSMSEKERTECVYKQAQADSLYVVNRILSTKEVRRNRFVGGYSFHTALLSTETEPPKELLETEGGEESDDPGAGKGGDLSAHVGANATSNATVETREKTKTRSEKGSTKPGAAKIHTPRAGNGTKPD